jgi:secondary thiamine-phosphate synthase enzyme
MVTYERSFNFQTEGNGTIVDLTGRLEEALSESSVTIGQIVVFVPGSTGAVTTVEFEPGLIRDLPEFFERIIPSGTTYHHDATWGDGNGFSHLRASLVGPSLSIPVSGGAMTLGTWQQVVFLEFDNRNRERTVRVSIIGE